MESVETGKNSGPGDQSGTGQIAGVWYERVDLVRVVTLMDLVCLVELVKPA